MIDCLGRNSIRIGSVGSTSFGLIQLIKFHFNELNRFDSVWIDSIGSSSILIDRYDFISSFEIWYLLHSLLSSSRCCNNPRTSSVAMLLLFYFSKCQPRYRLCITTHSFKTSLTARCISNLRKTKSYLTASPPPPPSIDMCCTYVCIPDFN